MKFPLTEIHVDNYNDEIFNLLEDNECTIFIDTNIIALMYGIHDSARKEFLDWIKSLIIKDRVKIPNWVVNEYSNRFIRNQIQDYLSPLSKIKTIKKEFKQVSAFLKMHIDNASLNKSKYSDVVDFQSDLKIIEEKIEKIEFTTDSKGQDYKIKIHNEIEMAFEKCIINDTNFDDILSKINDSGHLRYSHKLPPGFEDGKKDLNSHGDLILWYEILNFCKSNKVRKAILITNDEKRDWVYAPYKKIVNDKSISNSDPQFKIVDCRLVHEFKNHTDSEEFHIINFEQLTKILIGRISYDFINLANALQIVNSQKSETIIDDKETIDKVDEEKIGNNTEILQELKKQENGINTVPLTSLKYLTNSLSDRDFPLYDGTVLTKTIEELKTYNWYKQNPALQQFLEVAKKGIEENLDNSNKLFVIGRNIYQSACGGSSEAINFVSDLRSNFSKLTDYVINNLYAGIVYEIYFDSENKFRKENLKSHLMDEVFEVSDLDRLNNAKEFIVNSIQEYKNQLLYFPFQIDMVIIKPIFDNSTKIVKEEWFGDKEFLVLKELKGNDIDLLTAENENSLKVYFPNLNLLGLIDIVGKTYAVPENKLKVENSENVDSNFPITLDGRYFRKLSNTHK